MESSLIDKALATLRQGGTLLYPTDTIWGIGCDAANAAAVERIYTLKRRDPAKAMLVLATSSMLAPGLPSEAADLLFRSPQPTTVILPVRWLSLPVAPNLPAADGTVGVRLPRHDFCQQLLLRLGSPLVSTSANFSGYPAPTTYADIDPTLKQHLDLCLPDHPSFCHAPTGSSRILRLEADGSVTVIRS